MDTRVCCLCKQPMGEYPGLSHPDCAYEQGLIDDIVDWVFEDEQPKKGDSDVCLPEL